MIPPLNADQLDAIRERWQAHYKGRTIAQASADVGALLRSHDALAGHVPPTPEGAARAAGLFPEPIRERE